MGLKPGPAFKRLLEAVREAQLRIARDDEAEALAGVQQLLAEESTSPEAPPA